MDILELFQMKQVIADPTRITSKTTSLLDIIATNRLDKVKESGVIHLGISDHSLVYVSLKVSVPRDKPKIVERRNLKNYNINHFNSHISHLLRNSSWNHKDPTIYGSNSKTYSTMFLIYMLQLRLEKLEVLTPRG